MAMATLQREAREVAMLEQRWQQEIAVVEASSVMQALMLAAAKGKKGDGSAKMAATGKKQHWDRWQLSFERTAEGYKLQWEAEMAMRDHCGSVDRCSGSTGDVRRLTRVRLMIAATKMVRNCSKVAKMTVLLATAI
ncbi:hypothetical protein BHM03_00056977 [Ensete ventricosum]|nr:hypothetical protein BHM03_00056977 [Ensete ventricosum]